jgi:hypothetical protein
LLSGFIYCRYNFHDRALIPNLKVRGYTLTSPCAALSSRRQPSRFGFFAEYLSNGFTGFSDFPSRVNFRSCQWASGRLAQKTGEKKTAFAGGSIDAEND